MTLYIPREESYYDNKPPAGTLRAESNLVDGLLAAYCFFGDEADLVSGEDALLGPATSVIDSLILPGSAGSYMSLDALANHVFSDFTITLIGETDGTLPLDSHYVLIDNFQSGGTGEWFNIAYNTVTNTFGFNFDDGASAKGATVPGFPVNGGNEFVLSAVMSSGTGKLYIDGFEEASTSGHVGSIISPSNVVIGARAILDRGFSGKLKALYLHDKAVDANEIEDFHRAPYQIIETIGSLYAVPGGAVGSAPIMASALRGA
jgi:hypothetical protein